MICEFCECAFPAPTFEYEELADEPETDQKTFQSLKESSEGDCPVCLLLWKYLSAQVLTDSTSQPAILSLDGRLKISSEFRPSYSKDKPDTMQYSFTIGDASAYIPTFELPVMELGDRKEQGKVNRDYEFANSTDSPASWTVIQAWLDSCVDGHPQCGQTGTVKWLPTRLIDVGDPHKDTHPYVHITTPAQLEDQQKYLTLSHCWGSYQPARLLRQNYDSMLSSMPLQGLPKTFQDAISITRRLGFQYIWIDALCIIQDSPEDWNHEATLMEEVFKNSTCTIAASGSVDGSGGCFMTRDPRLVQPVSIGLVFPRVLQQVGYPAPRCRRVQVIASPHQEISQPTKLFTRGWVLQERLLSRRTVYFGETQLFWECRKLRCSEAFPYGLHKHFDDLITDEFRRYFDGSDTSPRGYSSIWEDFVTKFTSYDLTNPQDKLVALSGVVIAMKHNFGEYFCGMWKNDLVYQLLWTVETFYAFQYSHLKERRDEKAAFRPAKYRAPSWSWASVEGIVYFHHYETSGNTLTKTKFEEGGSDMISIHNIKAETTDTRGVGAVEAASLYVIGRPAMVTWQLVDEVHRLVTITQLKDGNGRVIYTFDHTDFVECDSFQDLKAWTRDVYCVPVMQNHPWLCCLVLQKNSKGHFERLGVFKTGGWLEQEFLKIPQQNMVLV